MKLKILYKDFDDKQRRITTDKTWVAWLIARELSKDNRVYDVQLPGEFGTAYFTGGGGGFVAWNELSTLPGQREAFDERTTFCIH